jgi:hypothetical protein
MAELEQELLSALQGVQDTSGEKPCGCQEKAGAFSDFASDDTSTGNLAGELDSALNEISFGAESGGFDLLDDLSNEDDLAFLEFAALDEGPQLDLNDIVTATERNPGLKITFSF